MDNNITERNIRENGFQLLFAGEYEEAEKTFDKLSKTDPHNFSMLLKAADNLIDMNRYTKAIEYLNAAMKHNRRKHYVYMGLAKICVRKAKRHMSDSPEFKEGYEEAISLLEKALIELPTACGIAQMIRRHYARIGNTEKSVEYLNLAKKLQKEEEEKEEKERNENNGTE
jgi:tetratricopeptide (TPR) repeat protein